MLSPEEDELEAEDRTSPPPILDQIPPLTSLTKVEPSPLLAFHLLDILFSYAFTLRLFNGDFTTDLEEAVSIMLSTSAVLSSKVVPHQYQSIVSTLQHCVESSLKVSRVNQFLHFTAIIE